MSRRITIDVKFEKPEILEAALKDLNAEYTRTAENYFQIRSGVTQPHGDAATKNFRYNGASVDFKTGKVTYDEDCKDALEFVTGPLRQMYAKNLFLEETLFTGDTMQDEFVVSDAQPVVDGWVGDLPHGTMVYVSNKPSYTI